MEKELLVLGMGNTLFGDDGVGIYIVNKLEQMIGKQEGIDFEYSSLGGFRIIDILQNYKTAIIIDSINSGDQTEGYIHIKDKNDFLNSIRMVSFHDINFTSAIEFAGKLNIPIPEKIYVYGIEVRNIDTFSEKLTPLIRITAENCIDLISDKIKEINKKIIITEKSHKYE